MAHDLKHQNSDVLRSSVSSPASLMLDGGPLAASAQLEVPEIAGIHLLRPAQPATQSVKTLIVEWKKCLPHSPTGDWASFRITKLEIRKKKFFSYQHASEFLLMCLANTEISVDLLVQRNIKDNTKHAGSGLPEDTLSILSPDHLNLVFQSSTLVKSISWGGSSSPSFADITIILNTVVKCFPMYTISLFNCYHFCAVIYEVLLIFQPAISPIKNKGKSKGWRIFWKKAVLDSVISRDCGLVMEKISTWKIHLERVSIMEGKNLNRAKEEKKC
ncbi:hypothetical protein JVU11DRAFT_3219 [Chiua virens]|nr:hypothetical protein JVU11DRAFT_3219 [Chiua virens]